MEREFLVAIKNVGEDKFRLLPVNDTRHEVLQMFEIALNKSNHQIASMSLEFTDGSAMEWEVI